MFLYVYLNKIIKILELSIYFFIFFFVFFLLINWTYSKVFDYRSKSCPTISLFNSNYRSFSNEYVAADFVIDYNKSFRNSLEDLNKLIKQLEKDYKIKQLNIIVPTYYMFLFRVFFSFHSPDIYFFPYWHHKAFIEKDYPLGNRYSSYYRTDRTYIIDTSQEVVVYVSSAGDYFDLKKMLYCFYENFYYMPSTIIKSSSFFITILLGIGLLIHLFSIFGFIKI